MKYIWLFILNIIIFVVLRYVSIIIIFLNGIGPYAKYSIWDYVPAFLFQVSFIAYLIIKNKGQKQKVIFYFIVIIQLTLLMIGSHFRLISNHIIPS